MRHGEMVCQWKLTTDAGFQIMSPEHKREGANVCGKKTTNFRGVGEGMQRVVAQLLLLTK
jgi:predicted secreted protein